MTATVLPKSATTFESVEQAVRHQPLRTGGGFWQGVFARWFSTFVYNQIWEDPRVDVDALGLTPESRILTISSGGCNVLHYLLADPAAVTAVDLNRNHLALLRLKLAAAQHLPGHEEFFGFFGDAHRAENRLLYEKHLRTALDPESREFWEKGPRLRRALWGPRIEYFRRNLYDHAQLGWFIRFLGIVVRVHGGRIERILQARTRAEQRAAFDRELAPALDGWLMKSVTGLPFALFSLGIPPQQADAMRRDAGGDLTGALRERVERLACGFPLSDNYFAWQAFARRYDLSAGGALPDYLGAANFPLLRERAARVSTEQAGLRGFLERQPRGAFDRFVFLDAQDWMPDQEIAALWAEVTRVGGPNARVIFRTAGKVSPIERALPSELRDRWFYHEEESEALHARDRSAIYGGFHLYSAIP